MKEQPTLPTSLRLLIIEDNPIDAEILISFLQSSGYTISHDVVDRPETFESNLESNDYDLILSDHNLRDWNGVLALEIFRRFEKNTPFIIVTSSLGDEAAVEYIKQGASDFVLKDRLERLPLAITRALREKTYRDATREAHEALQSVVDASPLPIVALGPDAKVRLWNTAATRTFGWSDEEALGQLNPIVPADKWDEFWNLFETVLGGKVLTAKEIVCQRKNGSKLTVELSCAPIRDAEGEVRGVTNVLADITERRLLEEQLQQAQKMEAIGRLAGGISHDFNNMLTIIMGHGQLMMEHIRDESPLRHHAEEIKRAGERAAGLTRQLLAFSRKQVVQPRVLDLNAAVANTQKMLRHLIGEDIEIMTSFDSDLGRVKSDPVQIEQIVVNLAVNARDAMPQGGKLVMETRNIDIHQSDLPRYLDAQPGSYVMLAISDTGCGITADILPHIFEPFFTTKGAQGTGLGLATVYGIVKQNGGYITVNSEPRHGATFTIYLPRVSDPLESIDVNANTNTMGHETILLVEDDAGVRELAREVLRSKGYSVLVAGDADQALDLARTHSGAIDLLLTDIVLPERSGKELGDQIALERPLTKILYMSGYTNDTISHHGFVDENVNLIEKPFTPVVLGRKVREVLDKTPRLNILVVDDNEATRTFLCATLEKAGHGVFNSAHGVDAWRLLNRLKIDLVITDLLMPYKDGIELITEIGRDWPELKVIAVSGAPNALTYAKDKFKGLAILEKPISPERLLAEIGRVTRPPDSQSR